MSAVMPLGALRVFVIIRPTTTGALRRGLRLRLARSKVGRVVAQPLKQPKAGPLALLRRRNAHRQVVLVAELGLAPHAQVVVEALQTLVPVAPDRLVAHVTHDVRVDRHVRLDGVGGVDEAHPERDGGRFFCRGGLLLGFLGRLCRLADALDVDTALLGGRRADVRVHVVEVVGMVQDGDFVLFVVWAGERERECFSIKLN